MIILVVAIIAYLKITNNSVSEGVTDAPKRGEPKTANYVKEKTGKYWDAVVYADYHAQYKFMCDEVTNFVSEDQYVQKYKDDEDSSSIATGYTTEDPEIDGDTARIRTKLMNPFFPEGKPAMTEMKYENGEWCKVLSQDTVLWLKGEGE